MTETYLWMKPKILGRDYVLLRDNLEHGRLTFDGACGTSARVNAHGSEWSVTRAGLMRPIITVRRGDAIVAEGRMRLGGGCDLIVGGRAFRWHSTSLFRGEFGWEHDGGQVVIRYLGAMSATRTVLAESALPEETKVLLLFLGGYLLALHTTDVATTSAAIAAASSVV